MWEGGKEAEESDAETGRASPGGPQRQLSGQPAIVKGSTRKEAKLTRRHETSKGEAQALSSEPKSCASRVHVNVSDEAMLTLNVTSIKKKCKK